MAIIIEEEQRGPKELHPAGLTQAVCVEIIDLGLQRSEYQGKEKVQRKVLFVWETSEKMEGGSPFLLTKKYTASMWDKANLRADLEGWAGKKFTEEQSRSFDIEVFKGRNCLLNIVHSDNGKYANIEGITPLMNGMTKIVPVLTDLPDGIKKWVEKMRSEAVKPADGKTPHPDDDLPEFLR